MPHNKDWEKFISKEPSKAHKQAVFSAVEKELRKQKKSSPFFSPLILPWIPAFGIMMIFIVSLNFIPKGLVAPQFVDDADEELIDAIEEDLDMLDDLELIEIMDLLEGWDES